MDGLCLPWKFMVDRVGPTFCRSASHGLSRKTSKNRTSERSVASTLKPKTSNSTTETWPILREDSFKQDQDSYRFVTFKPTSPKTIHVPSIYKTRQSLPSHQAPRGPWVPDKVRSHRSTFTKDTCKDLRVLGLVPIEEGESNSGWGGFFTNPILKKICLQPSKMGESSSPMVLSEHANKCLRKNHHLPVDSFPRKV